MFLKTCGGLKLLGKIWVDCLPDVLVFLAASALTRSARSALGRFRRKIIVASDVASLMELYHRGKLSFECLRDQRLPGKQL